MKNKIRSLVLAVTAAAVLAVGAAGATTAVEVATGGGSTAEAAYCSSIWLDHNTNPDRGVATCNTSGNPTLPYIWFTLKCKTAGGATWQQTFVRRPTTTTTYSFQCSSSYPIATSFLASYRSYG